MVTYIVGVRGNQFFIAVFYGFCLFYNSGLSHLESDRGSLSCVSLVFLPALLFDDGLVDHSSGLLYLGIVLDLVDDVLDVAFVNGTFPQQLGDAGVEGFVSGTTKVKGEV